MIDDVLPTFVVMTNKELGEAIRGLEEKLEAQKNQTDIIVQALEFLTLAVEGMVEIEEERTHTEKKRT